MTDDAVVVDDAGLAGRWRRFPNYDVWVAFRPSRPDVEVAEVEALSTPPTPKPPRRRVDGGRRRTWLTTLEPVKHVVLPLLRRAGDLMVWVGRFAQASGDDGLAGMVGPGPTSLALAPP